NAGPALKRGPAYSGLQLKLILYKRLLSFPRSGGCESIIKISLKTYSPRRHEVHEEKIID
ncbi:MAG: hypothetical protein NTY50_00340, partial [Methylobacter sp.]|nr:hypothetical protein [Methylobacter sp.]